MHLKRLSVYFVLLATPLAFQAPFLASASSGTTLVISVDHLDTPNQQFVDGRAWAYTDFFSRKVSVHQGDILDFNFALPGHLISVAPDEAAARAALPLFGTDADDGTAPGSGAAPIDLAPTALAAFAAPPAGGCGTAPASVCHFNGTFDPTMLGPQGSGPDWFVQIDASPGTYHYLCFVHPGMTGTLEVVAGAQPSTTQAQVNASGHAQFISDRAQATDAEAAANVPSFTGGAPGTRTYTSYVGLNAAKNHVAMFEMLPAHLNLVQGDSVRFVWQFVEAHSVTLPRTNDSPQLFFPDCGPPDQFFGQPPGSPIPICGDDPSQPEIVLDVGSSPPGTALTAVGTQLDSGILIGAGYNVPGTVQSWSVSTNGSTAPTASNPYTYHCVIHDWMNASIDVSTH